MDGTSPHTGTAVVVSKKVSGFLILLTNAFGMISKLPELQHAALVDKPDLIVITESKLLMKRLNLLILHFTDMKNRYDLTELHMAVA